MRQAESEQAGSDSWTENIHIKEEIRKERTIPSRFQPKLGPHGSVSRQHAPAQCPVWFARNDLQYVFSGFAPFARFGFTNNGLGIARFAWFGSQSSHGSVSEVRARPSSVLRVRFHKSSRSMFNEFPTDVRMYSA